MTVAVVIQARFASTRAPGKVLALLGARTALALCLQRCARIEGVDAVVCAVANDAPSDAVAAEAERAGAIVVRGPETDVLARYAAAATAVRADIVMRVTSDCPFVDPDVCAETLAWRAHTGADYACNNAPAGFPHGLDCEVFTAALLHAEARTATAAEAREHVTAGMRRAPGLRRARVVGPGGGVERLRWTLDYPEDVAFAQALAAAAPDPLAAPWRELADICAARPDIVALNASRVDTARLDTLRAAAADETIWPAALARVTPSGTAAR
ncbi:MAG: NTP transferase domain-containing protein [Alphaproteobacteria bacterium]|nr:NTP transferase domain-containing protein [Alphaproteobacteria bacterium]